jgi:hypothetical protein
MARIGAILASIQKMVWRDVQSVFAISSNNLLAFALLLFAKQPESAEIFVLFILVAAFILLSDDPAKKVASRLRLWPLTAPQMIAVRFGAFLLTPSFLLAAGASIASQQFYIATSLGGIALGVQIGRSVCARLRLPQGLRIASFTPVLAAPGITSLAMLQIRQMLSMLDTYLAAAFSIGGLWYLRLPDADPYARSILAMLVALALSTHTQSLLGYDGVGGMARFRLWPIPGWRILAFKDLGVLSLATLLLLPLDPLVGLSSLCSALAIGHYGSLHGASLQRRWRFCSGRLVMVGILQIVAVFGVGTFALQAGPRVLGASATVCAISVWYYGRQWSRAGAA